MRVRGITIILDQDYGREDFEERIAPVLHSLRFVGSVEPVVVAGAEQMARLTANMEIEKKVYEAINEVFRPSWMRKKDE